MNVKEGNAGERFDFVLLLLLEKWNECSASHSSGFSIYTLHIATYVERHVSCTSLSRTRSWSRIERNKNIVTTNNHLSRWRKQKTSFHLLSIHFHFTFIVFPVSKFYTLTIFATFSERAYVHYVSERFFIVHRLGYKLTRWKVYKWKDKSKLFICRLL